MRRIVFSEFLFRLRHRAHCLTDLSGLSRADGSTCRRVSFERIERDLPLPCFLRNSLSPRNSLIHLLIGATIWCQVTLSVIPAEFSAKQLAGLIKRFAGNVCFHAKRPIHVRTHHKCFSFTFIFFAMFQSMNMTSFEKIGARDMKNELKW